MDFNGIANLELDICCMETMKEIDDLRNFIFIESIDPSSICNKIKEKILKSIEKIKELQEKIMSFIKNAILKEKIDKAEKKKKNDKLSFKITKKVSIPDFFKLFNLRKKYEDKIMRAKSREEVERLKEAYTKERNDCIKSGLKSVALAVAIIEITKAIMYFIKNWPTQANLKKLEEEARRTGDKQDAQLELYNLALDKIAAISQLVMNGKMDITEAKKRFSAIHAEYRSERNKIWSK